jgi:hypothetical protein
VELGGHDAGSRGRDRSPSVQVLESLARVLHLDDNAREYLLGLAADRPRRPRRPLVPGANRLRDLFLDPEEQARWPDWTAAATALVASFRGAVGTDTDDPRFIELVGELSLVSPLFRRLWARHDVRPRAGAAVTFLHPRIGELRLNRESSTSAGRTASCSSSTIPIPAPPTRTRSRFSARLGGSIPAALTDLVRSHYAPDQKVSHRCPESFCLIATGRLSPTGPWRAPPRRTDVVTRSASPS